MIAFRLVVCFAISLVSSVAAGDLAERSDPSSGNSGVKVDVAADAETHSLRSPSALAFDPEGGVFVAEADRFDRAEVDPGDDSEWILEELAATRPEDRLAVIEKWRERLVPERTGAESIRFLADATGEGGADRSRVFAERFDGAADGSLGGIFEHEGTVYVARVPEILALRDTTGDGVADEQRVLFDGFGARVLPTGHGPGGFALGPDGRIYGTVGDHGFQLVTREGEERSHPDQGVVFRFDPDGSGFEVVHTGLRNPRGIAFDEFGNAFVIDQGSDEGDLARIVQIVEGGDSGWEWGHEVISGFYRQIGLEVKPPVRWTGERMWEPANPEQPAFLLPPAGHLASRPSGLTHHPGVGFLESEVGRFLFCDDGGNPAMSGVRSFGMKPEGAGMVPDEPREILSGVVATDLRFSWDGRLFLTDVTGVQPAGAGGRLLSVAAEPAAYRAADAASSAKFMREGFEQRGAAELVFLLRHPDFRVRLRAQLALTRKPEAFEKLVEAVVATDRNARRHAIWGLGILARRGSAVLPASEFSAVPSAGLRDRAEAKLIELLDDKDEEIRWQVLRALLDATTGRATLPISHLLADESPKVRFFAALLAGKRGMAPYFGNVCEMLAGNDNRDPYLRHAGAYALHGMFDDPAMLRVMSTHPSAAVRLATVVALRRSRAATLVDFLRDPDPRVADETIRAICDLDITGVRPAVALLLDDTKARTWSPFMLRRLLHNSFQVGSAADATRVLAFAADPSQPGETRVEAFRLLGEWIEPLPVDSFTGRWRPLENRDPAVILPVMRDGLPGWIESGDIITLEGAVGLIRRHGLDIEEPQESRLRALRDAADTAAAADAATTPDPEVMRLGRSLYIVCAACHGPGGEGAPTGPPLAGSEWVTGPAENLIRIQLRGLEGPITVKGRTYDIADGMAPLAYQNDVQIAAVLTYVRNSFGNSAPAVTPAEVAALRGEVGKPKLLAEDLIPPTTDASDRVAADPTRYDNLREGSGSRWWLAGIVVAVLIVVVVRKVRGKRPDALPIKDR